MRISDWSSDVCSSDLAHPSVAGRVEQRGFAAGAPHASRHGTAVASLLIGSGAVRGAAPGGRLLAADVYGSDPAGGSASAIARALGWLVPRGVAVTTISLVGPDNKLLATAVSRAKQRDRKSVVSGRRVA